MLKRQILTITILTLMMSFTARAESAVKDLFKKVNNGVVELHVIAIAAPKTGQVLYKETKEKTLGSGALINKNGNILTAAHVVGRSVKIEVLFANGSKSSGHVVWVDKTLDLAMIRARKVPDDVEPLKLAAPGSYNIGEQVIAIGAPYGASHSLSVGYLSAVREREFLQGSNIKAKFLQTDASINQGNSGGPLFNLDGDIIGIVSHILSRSGGSNGLGFVVSVDTIHSVIESEPPEFLGFIPYMLKEKQAKALNNPFGYGLLIQNVIPATLADKLGFKGGYINVVIGRQNVLLGGDIILEIDGVKLDSIENIISVRNKFGKFKKGEKVSFKFLRNGVVKDIVWDVD
ncbi:trypsin-like serine protease [Thalassotalea sp. HSM 43]|uniref:S1C family serine protease n=1 Tax=Thalassotalea sp. HSM 43 TaxID=2552945 RepID=UPI001082230D|nr:trypsin-like peptidase domain-containing protein [Thalassotalea sp. HSM 43]QBY05405.1 trypsin-like serine protease [Thalassotalea sp. HSM 43]